MDLSLRIDPSTHLINEVERTIRSGLLSTSLNSTPSDYLRSVGTRYV